MILLDSLHINAYGGKVLLDYLVLELERSGIDIFYLFDDRCRCDYQNVPIERKLYLKASVFNRFKFYQMFGSRFSKILCFGNIPPYTKQKGEVITYFHQLLYLNKIDKNLGLKKKLRLIITKTILNLIKSNSHKWLVQMPNIKEGLIEKFNINKGIIDVLSFYPPFESDNKKYERKKESYIYISSGALHKNQKLLIETFCDFYDKYRIGELTLTVPEKFVEICSLIQLKQRIGYPINNLGFVERNKLYSYLQSHEYLVFPSLAETFGLGIVEAIENGCKVIGADLPYMHNVCAPSITFNPFEKDSMFNALALSLNNNIKHSESKVNNNIEELINLLR